MVNLRQALISPLLSIVLSATWSGAAAVDRPAEHTDRYSLNLPFRELTDRTASFNSHLVFAHYVPQFPISEDNRPAREDYYTTQYLSPEGEGGKHLATGGFLRERPIPRGVLSGDWELQDMITDVRRAQAAGIDGFTVDVPAISGYPWVRVKLLIQAAGIVSPKFKIILMPDMASLAPNIAALVRAIASVRNMLGLYHLSGGRLVLAPYLPERSGAPWWSEWLNEYKAATGQNVALVPCFLSLATNAKSFAPISFGFSDWGVRDASAVKAMDSDAAISHSYGKIWMQSVSPQDERPHASVYTESDNTEAFRDAWTLADKKDADWVQIVTWNDYSESTEIAPSTHIGWTLLDLSAYLIDEFKTHSTPRPISNAIYLTYRVAPASATAQRPDSLPMRTDPGTPTPRNDIEVLTLLESSATIHVTVGWRRYSYRAGTGLSSHDVPLTPGTPKVTVQIGRKSVARLAGEFKIRKSFIVQDEQYYATDNLEPRP